ncbi:ubiquinol-cytochrome-c reductase complex subunit 6 [Ganoderma leucocontextum]|nr:ubiquinol-cytochrome-c reductase complex subunit 6 [Ganoderma leucocontextum]
MTVFGPLGLSLAPAIRRNRSVYAWVKPVADWYANVSGYRKLGLKYDDLLVEERPDVQRALGRLTDREAYDRQYRFKRASQASVVHDNIPKEEWIKPEEDIRYLKPHVQGVVAEDQERWKWDNIEVSRTR